MKITQLLQEKVRNRRLTKTQKEVLALVHVAETPYTADANTTGTLNLHYARESLVRWGYLQVSNNGITLTDKGNNALTSAGIIDNGGLTDYGRTILDSVDSN